jgi:hypothetical protein
MNLKNDKSPLPPTSLPVSLLQAVPADAKGSGAVTYMASDCLYQFAALTAGAFLLATML